MLLLTHDLKRGLEIVIDDEVALPGEEIAPLGRIERPEARARVRLEGIEKLGRQHCVRLGKGPPFLLRLPGGVGIEEHRIEVQIVRSAIQRQRQGSARVDAQTAKECTHLDRITVLLVRIEEATEPRKGVPVIRQVDRACLERIGELRERELGVGNEKDALRGLKERASSASNGRTRTVDPACMQLEARRTDDAARISGKRKGRTTGEPERSRLARSQSGDGGVRGHDTIGLDAHRLRVGLAILAKDPQTIAGARRRRQPIRRHREKVCSCGAFARRNPGTVSSR